MTVAAELRHQRILESIATNPQFSFISPRFFTAYAESVLPLHFFVDGRNSNQELNMVDARGFFQNSQMPDDFFRPKQPIGFREIAVGVNLVFDAHPIQPGTNQGVGNYVLDPASANISNFCLLYTNFVNNTVRSLYPSPTGILLDTLNSNLDIFFSGIQGCPQVFPYGKN